MRYGSVDVTRPNLRQIAGVPKAPDCGKIAARCTRSDWLPLSRHCERSV